MNFVEVDKTLKCDHSSETYWAVLFLGNHECLSFLSKKYIYVFGIICVFILDSFRSEEGLLLTLTVASTESQSTSAVISKAVFMTSPTVKARVHVALFCF